jgi:predicted Fe-Mo cluster-binding NifX family protein
MKVAVTVWEDSVSTACDFCNGLLIFDIEANEMVGRSALSFESQAWSLRVNQLKALGVGVLLCGAISRPLERTLVTAGIQVISWLCGPVEEIIRAYLDGGLSDARFILPGFGPGASRVRGRKRWRRGGVCRLPDQVKGDDGEGRG